MSINVNGSWQILQGNDENLFVNSTLDGTHLTGSVTTDEEDVGNLDGTLTGTSFGSIADFKISWDDGSTGSYMAMLNNDIRLVGITFTLDDPLSQATWVSS